MDAVLGDDHVIDLSRSPGGRKGDVVDDDVLSRQEEEEPKVPLSLPRSTLEVMSVLVRRVEEGSQDGGDESHGVRSLKRRYLHFP